MKNKSQRIGLSVIAILLVSSFLHGQIKIMPLGDSITWGITEIPEEATDEGYRGFLYDSLSSGGYNFDFVGGLQNGDSLTDKDHEGHPAWYANKSSSCGGNCVGPGIAAAVDSFLTANPADIVLLHIGTNDLILMDDQQVDDTDGLVADVQLIISNIHTFNSEIIIICALIINSSENANITALTTSFNTKLNNALTESSTLRIVNMESALSYPADIVTNDASHNVHPNVSGYKKMADVWFDELKYVIENILPVELTSFTGFGTNSGVTLNWKTATEVNNFGFEIERKLIENKSVQNSSDWETIGFVEGYGNSNSPKSYSFLDKRLVGSNCFYYRLKQIDNDGQYEYSQIIEVELTPNEFELKQNYPNPFNPATTIEYYIPEKEFVNLSIFNSLGEKVRTLVNKEQAQGNYKIEFNAGDLSSGVYYYKIAAGTNLDIKKLVLLK
jgi:lysophospholipase L1-like esterase